MRRGVLTLLGLAGFVLIPNSARALSLIEASRLVTITGTNFDPVEGPLSTSVSAVDPLGSGRWTSDLVDARDPSTYASQDLLISDGELSGTGSVGKSGTGVYDSASTRFHVVFALDATTAYEFSVTNLGTNGCCTWAPGGSVTLDQVDPGNLSLVLKPVYSVALGRDDTGIGFPNSAAQGTLLPGTYALNYFLGVAASHNASAPGTASFVFAPIPEPSTGLLVMVGLLAVAVIKRGRA
jgi:hypothetical protein